MPGTRTGSKPGGNSQDPIKPLPRGELSPHLAVITSTDVHILRAIATSLIKLLYTPNLMEVLSRSARLTGLDKAETDDLLDTMVLRLGVLVYIQVMEAVCLGTYSGCLRKSSILTDADIINTEDAIGAALALNDTLAALLDIQGPYDVFQLTLDIDAAGFRDVLKSDRAQANLATFF